MVGRHRGKEPDAVLTRSQWDALSTLAAQAPRAAQMPYMRSPLSAHADTGAGGMLPPGLSTVYNGTRAWEYKAVFTDAKAAAWREYWLRQTAHDDAAAIAQAEGHPIPHDPGTTAPNIGVHVLHAAIEVMTQQRITEGRAESRRRLLRRRHRRLDAHDAEANEQRAEDERRRLAAESVAAGSVDVTGMSEDLRAELGLPPGIPPRRERGR